MKIFLKVLRGLLIVAPFAIAYFTNNEFSDSGFFLFYIIASLLLIGAILGVAFYEDQWDGDPGTPCRVIRVIVLIAMAILSALSGVDDNLVLDEWYTYMMVVLLFTIFFYFMYLELSFISPGVFFTIISALCVISLVIIPLFKLEPASVEVLGGVAIGAGVLAFPLAFVISKVSGLFSGRGSGRARSSSSRGVSYDAVCRAVSSFNREYSGKYSAGVKSSSGAIYVTLTDNYGERVYGTDASRLRAYLESKLHIDLDNCNIYIRY